MLKYTGPHNKPKSCSDEIRLLLCPKWSSDAKQKMLICRAHHSSNLLTKVISETLRDQTTGGGTGNSPLTKLNIDILRQCRSAMHSSSGGQCQANAFILGGLTVPHYAEVFFLNLRHSLLVEGVYGVHESPRQPISWLTTNFVICDKMPSPCLAGIGRHVNWLHLLCQLETCSNWLSAIKSSELYCSGSPSRQTETCRVRLRIRLICSRVAGGLLGYGQLFTPMREVRIKAANPVWVPLRRKHLRCCGLGLLIRSPSANISNIFF